MPLAQIDPATDIVVAWYGPPSEGSGGIYADDQAVWVSDYLDQTPLAPAPGLTSLALEAGTYYLEPISGPGQ